MSQIMIYTKKVVIRVSWVFLSLIILSQSSTPATPFLFKIKRLQETAYSYVKFSPGSKISYYHWLLKQRLDELTYLVYTGQHDYILNSSLRYSSTAGKLTEYIEIYKTKGSVPPILQTFKQNQDTILKMIESYPKERDQEWKYLQDDINYLTIYSQRLSKL